MYNALYIFILQVYPQEEEHMLKDNLLSALSSQIMFPNGTDDRFKDINHKKYRAKEKNINEFIIDETQIKVGSQYI